MKSSIVLVVFSIVVAPALAAVAAPFQDLDRIKEIVNQARGLADVAGSGVSQTNRDGNTPSSDAETFSNPFARGTNSSPPEQPTVRPRVGIGNDGIQIEAGGRKFSVPRVGGIFEGDDVDPHLAAPTRNALVEGSILGPNNRTSEALGMANNYRIFSAATKLFRNADYRAALDTIQTVIPNGNMGPIEQFQALCLFSNSDYEKSAELAYAAVAKTSFYSWDQLRSYYSSPDLYAQQYRRLQADVANHPSDPTRRFLLGYHHLMLGHREHAAREFEFVLTKLPNDPIVNQLLSISRQFPPSPSNHY